MLSREDSPSASYPVPPYSHSYARSQAVKQEDCIVEISEVEALGMVGRDGGEWWRRCDLGSETGNMDRNRGRGSIHPFFWTAESHEKINSALCEGVWIRKKRRSQ